MHRFGAFRSIVARAATRERGCTPAVTAAHVMRVTRVAINTLPRMLFDIVHAALARQPDIELFGGVAGAAALAPASPTVDVAIVGTADGALTTDGAALLYAHPRSRVLVIATAADAAFCYQLQPSRTPLGPLSRDGLRAAVRGTAVGGTATLVSTTATVDHGGR